ncbi:MAG: DUF255 domain-containing protein [Sedimentisphaerales bacterium]|nr:DUF255 domain-containing protein [Sedimentisphaerales bacterium]
MAQTPANKHDVSTNETSKQAQPSANKKLSRALWIVILVFTIFVAIVFLTQNREQIAWKDYQTGIELAKKQNKPALLCFSKQNAPFCSYMWQTVYNKPDVKKYVEANFIPILIDVDKQPEIARRYNVTYYPTHYVENPDTNEIDGPFVSASRLLEFIKQPRKYAPKSSVLR